MSKDGGSAFPEIYTDPANDPHGLRGDVYGNTYSYGGMSRLDYFAAAALQGLIANDVALAAFDKRVTRDPETHYDLVARDAFHFAAAMLAESERRGKA